MLAELILKVAGFERYEGKEIPYYPRPSYAGPERCLRAICYEAQGHPKKFTDRFFAVLDDSSWHEELTLDLLRKSAFRVHSEQMVVECGEVLHNGKPFKIKGRIDGIITDLQGVDRLLEHKAINHFTFERYGQEGFPMDYLAQMVLYFVGLEKVNPEIREGVLLIKNKNTSQYLEFLVDFDVGKDLLRVLEVVRSDGMRRDGAEFEGLYGQALERFSEVERHRAAGTLPPRQYEPGDWRCGYCSFEQMCNEESEKTFSSLSGEVIELPEIEGVVKKHIELSFSKKEIEGELEGVKEELKRALKTVGHKQVRSNGYSVSLTIQKRNTIDKNLIPPEILKDIQKETLVEVLSVRPGKTSRV